MPRLALVLLPLLLPLVVAACEPLVPEGRFACDTDEDCPDEMVCRTNVSRCFASHAGAPDAGASDAGASERDAGSADATP